MPTPQPGGSAHALFPPVIDFPPLIGRALARAAGADGAGLCELDSEERALLVRIVRNVAVAAPAESVRISNITLAAALRTGERTVRRLKAALEAKGWITRRQVQSRSRGMQVLDIWLTPHALSALFGPDDAGLDPRRSKLADALLASPRSSRQPCGASQDVPSQDDGERTADQTPSDRSASTSAPEQTPDCIEPTIDLAAQRAAHAHHLPEDVRLLADVGGVTVAGVRLLMGVATRAGTKLGDLLAAAGDAVVKARHPFAYAKQLIHCGKDWSAIAREKRQQDDERRGAERKVEDLQLLVEAMAEGRMYSHPKRQYVWRAEFGRVWQSSVPDAAAGGIGRWLPMVDVGRLATAWREGRVLPVTPAELTAWTGASGASQVGPDVVRGGAGEATSGPSDAVRAALQAVRGRLRQNSVL